jgi:hypothetical protein
MLQTDRESKNKIQGCDLCEEVVFRDLGVRVVVSLVDVDPDVAGEVPALHTECGPGFAAVGVAFVGGGGAEGEGETDYETEDCEEEVVYADLGGVRISLGDWGN